jgi:hypothetical protein
MVELNSIVCPKCGHRFPITKALTGQIENSLRHEFEVHARDQQKAAQAAFEKRFAIEREKFKKVAQTNMEKQLAVEKSRLERAAVEKAKAQIAELREQIRDNKAAVWEMQKREAAWKAKEGNLQKEIDRKVEAARMKERQEARESIEKEYHIRELLHQKAYADVKQQLSDARQKLDQSSQQAQGEVIELELTRTLTAAFPEDKIRPIAKGKLGADIIHKVISPGGKHCGTIVWESKNTRNWNKSWLAKLRTDQRREKAEIAVIVSSVLPKDMQSHIGQISGVWVADFSVAVGLAIALRANLIELSRIQMASQGKPEKMEILYQYLMSTEFKQRVEAIVEAFATMKDELEKEMLSTERNWAKRHKHLDLILQNVSGMVGEIQGIAPAFPKIKRLELPGSR